jgi:hypothetical protein
LFAFRVEYVLVSVVLLGFSGIGINSKDSSGKIGPLIPPVASLLLVSTATCIRRAINDY